MGDSTRRRVWLAVAWDWGLETMGTRTSRELGSSLGEYEGAKMKAVRMMEEQMSR